MAPSARPISRRSLLMLAAAAPLAACAPARYAVPQQQGTGATEAAKPSTDFQPAYVARFSTGNDAYVFRGDMPFSTEFIGRSRIETATNYRARDRFSVGGTGPAAAGAEKERAEYACHQHVTYGEDFWISFQVNLTDFIPDTWFLFTQFHDVPDKGEVATVPPLAFELLTGSLGMRVAARSSPHLMRTSPSDIVETTLYRLPTLQRNMWHHFVLRTKFARTGLGRVDLWHNGTAVYRNDVPLGYNDAVSPYYKYGTYRGATSGLASAEFATVEASTSSLEHRVKTPLPITPVAGS